MSITESTLDSITLFIANSMTWVLFKLPVYAMPYLLRMYTYILSFSYSVKAQGLLTFEAIAKSFEEESLYFLKYDRFYVPIPLHTSTQPILSGPVDWIYYTSTSKFIYTDAQITLTKRLPYIGACLYLNDTLVGDMSEWIQDQTSNVENVPLQVLVCAWAYKAKVSLQHNYEGYTLTVMDLEGEEYEYDVSTEELIEELEELVESALVEESVEQTTIEQESIEQETETKDD
jgi:hypothetical protein